MDGGQWAPECCPLVLMGATPQTQWTGLFHWGTVQGGKGIFIHWCGSGDVAELEMVVCSASRVCYSVIHISGQILCIPHEKYVSSRCCFIFGKVLGHGNQTLAADSYKCGSFKLYRGENCYTHLELFLYFLQGCASNTRQLYFLL